MNCRRLKSAFTLIELLVVIAIIGILAAIVAPTLTGVRQGDAIAAGTSQLLGGVARARQLAISHRTDVYMVFLPTNYWGLTPANWAALSQAEKNAVTNLADKQLTGYTFVSFRTVGDQPGQRTVRYHSPWQQLPAGVFISPETFAYRTTPLQPVKVINDAQKGEIYRVYPLHREQFPFPLERSTVRIELPCLVFDYQGRVVSRPPQEDAEFIPIASGVVSIPRNPTTKRIEIGPADADERPPGNSTNGYNVVSVDWLTGRGRLERREVQ